MPEVHRKLDIQVIGQAAVHELHQTRVLLQHGEAVARDHEVARAFGLCARIHADLLADLTRAGLSVDAPTPSFTPLDTPTVGSLDEVLLVNDFASAGVMLRRHMARTVELLECLFADYPSMQVRRAIKLHFSRVLRSVEIMRRLSLRHAA